MSLKELLDRITHALQNITADMLHRVGDEFDYRVDVCRVTQRAHIEGLWLTQETAVAQWLRCCATNRNVAGSIPDGFIGIFHWHTHCRHGGILLSINYM